MKTIGFVGASGTGKSYRAMWVAGQNNIPLVIDDGLLLSERKILAGKSAKKEPTKLASVRRALFTEQEHVNDVKAAIRESGKDSILILGTSENMVKKIAEVLCLPTPETIIHIEDVAEPEEIEKALRTRREQGKHVIPLPTFAVKKEFSGYFLDSVKIFLKGKSKKGYEEEKTVVRPTFSYLGEFNISRGVLQDIAAAEAKKVDGVSRVLKAQVVNGMNGAEITVEISVFPRVRIPEVAKEIQRHVPKALEQMADINTTKVNVLVKTID